MICTFGPCSTVRARGLWHKGADEIIVKSSP